MAKSIFIGFRENLAELFETEFATLPKVKKYETISYSNSNPFTYTNDVVLNSEIIEDSEEELEEQYTIKESSDQSMQSY